MEKRILAICDREADYAHRMMEALKGRRDLHFDIHVFTGAESLAAFSAHPIECLLISESDYTEAVAALAIPHVFILNEGGIAAGNHPSPGEGRPYTINKYQSADHIAGDIITHYATRELHLPGKPARHAAAARIIGLYSPVRRCLQTTFSMTLGQLLAQKHRSLYLNFECFSGWEKLSGRRPRTDITDMMYLFECVRDKFIFKLPTITEQIGGLDYIAPAAGYPDLRDIPGRLWTELLSELRGKGDYAYIILDLNDYVNGLLSILKECDWIYTIAKGDFHAQAKMEHYEAILSEQDHGDIAAMTRRIQLPVFRNIPVRYDEMTYGELAAYIKEKIVNDLYA